MYDGAIQWSGTLEQPGTQSKNNGSYPLKVGRQGRMIKKNNGKALCLLARDYKGFGNQEMNGVAEWLRDVH